MCASGEEKKNKRSRMKKWVMNIKYRGGSVMASTVSVLTEFIVTGWVQGLSQVLKWLRGELSASHFLWQANLPLTHSTYAYSVSNSLRLSAWKWHVLSLFRGVSQQFLTRGYCGVVKTPRGYIMCMNLTLKGKIKSERTLIYFFSYSYPLFSAEP